MEKLLETVQVDLTDFFEFVGSKDEKVGDYTTGKAMNVLSINQGGHI